MDGLRRTATAWMLAVLVFSGCKHFEVTAVPLSRWNCDEPEGIPFYLPKPLLIITKNVHFVESEKIGLTDTAPIPNQYDDQAKYADVNARTDFRGLPGGETSYREAAGSTGSTVAAGGAASVSGQHLFAPKPPYLSAETAPGDGLFPHTFFTVQIVFVPDLTQKYGLRIRGGGPGEVRAALNLVNGWMFTGLGPFYFKDSSTAQNILAAGIGSNLMAGGVADVVRSLAELRRAAPDGGITPEQLERALAPMREAMRLAATTPRFDLQPGTLADYAEIYVYEPSLTPDGQMTWQQVTALKFNREYLGYYTGRQPPADTLSGPPEPAAQAPADVQTGADTARSPAGAGPNGTLEAALVARALGLPPSALEPLETAATASDHPVSRRGHRHSLMRSVPVLRHFVPRRVREQHVRVDLDRFAQQLTGPAAGSEPPLRDWAADYPDGADQNDNSAEPVSPRSAPEPQRP